MKKISENFPAFKEADVHKLEAETKEQFEKVIHEWLRMTPEWLDESKPLTLPNGVEREFCKDNVFCYFTVDEENYVHINTRFLTDIETKKKCKWCLKRSVLDIYDNKRFDHFWTCDIPILKDDKYTFTKEDIDEMFQWVVKWYAYCKNSCIPLFAFGHADETEVYIHWHLVFLQPMDYSRRKRLTFLWKKADFLERNKKK